MSTTPARPTPTTVAEHLAGPPDSWHAQVSNDPSNPFKPDESRYHLYIGLFCPFAHRANLIRHLKGLQDILTLSVVRPYPKGDADGWPGWRFNHHDELESEYEGATVDHLFGSKFLHEVYFRADPNYKGRYSVPVLWDKQSNTIVNNESAELMRFLQDSFNDILSLDFARVSLYPEHLRAKIDEVSIWMQRDLNTGVYKAGFAPDQATYDKNIPPVFAALNASEKLLAASGGPYLLGKELTELDIRLYATAVRFDTVYVQHFKCNLTTIRLGYPHLENWMRNLYWNVKGFKETTNFKHIKENYTKSHGEINPRAITPLGPWPDMETCVEKDWAKLEVGQCGHPQILKHEQEALLKR